VKETESGRFLIVFHPKRSYRLTAVHNMEDNSIRLFETREEAVEYGKDRLGDGGRFQVLSTSFFG